MNEHSRNVETWLTNLHNAKYPHRPCLLLAVLDLAEAEGLQANFITYSPWLIETFALYFNVVRTNKQLYRAYAPFVHLSDQEIWTLVAHEGYDDEVRDKPRKGGTSNSWVLNHVSHVELDQDFASKIKRKNYRDALRREIVESCQSLRDHQEALYSLINRRTSTLAFERKVRNAPSIRQSLQLPETARDERFRRSVLKTYDYTCAATGWRAVVGSVHLLDVAYLIPLSESNDYRVQNGIVLTPTYCRAMDSHLIAPGPDHRWHVAEFVNHLELPEYEPIRQLNNKRVHYGKVEQRPDPRFLEMKVSKLMKSQT